MPIYLHLDLLTSSNPVPPIPPHTPPARTLYHSKRLKDLHTKDAFTSELATKVAKISHTFSQLTTQLRSSNTTPQSFADTTNAALSDILQHAAHVVLGKVDPHTPQKMNPTNSLPTITLSTIPPQTPKKLISKVIPASSERNPHPQKRPVSR